MILRVLALFGVLAISSLAHAQTSFGTFVWERDGDFTLQFIYNGKAAELKGNLREDPPGVPVEVQVIGENGFTVNVKAFPEGTAYAVVSEQFDDQAMIFFMQRQVGFYSAYNTQAIMTFKASGVSDANGVLEILEKTQGWDSAQAMLSTAKYFAENPTVKLNPYRNSVESGEVAPPDPTPTVAPSVVDGVVEMPDKVVRPPKLDVEEPVTEQPVVDQPLEEQPPVEQPPVEQPPVDQPIVQQPSEHDGDDDQFVPDQPLDLSGGDFMTAPEEVLRPPLDIPKTDDGGFVPQDMTDGWDGDEPVAAPSNNDAEWLAQERERQAEERRRRRLDSADDDLS